MPARWTQPKSEQLAAPHLRNELERPTETERQRPLPARPVRAARIVSRSEMADEMGLHRETGLIGTAVRHRVLDLGQRLLEALLRRIAPVDDDLEQGRDLPSRWCHRER